MSNTNAEASISRIPSTSKRGRRESRSKPDKGKGKEVDINDGGKLKSPDPSVGNDGSMRTLSPNSGIGSAREGGSTARRVRTVPPSAIYEPPTPPSPAHAPLPHLENPILSPEPQPAKRRRRLRYSSSSDSSVDSDDEETSDDEPPWWTFTQRGMAKLRAKNLHRNGRDVEQGEQEHVGEVTEGESGKEKEKESYFSFNKEKHRMSGVFLPSSRRSSKDREGVLPTNNNGSTPSSLKNFKRFTESPSTTLSSGVTGPSHLKLLHPAPIRFSNSTQHFFRRSAHNPSPDKLNNPRQATDPASHPGGVKRTKSVPTRPASAPTSPTVEAPSPGMTTLVDDLSSRLPSHESTHPLQAIEGGEPNSPRRFSKRQLTAPNFPRFFRRNDTDTEGEHEPLESLTDTEVIPSAAARSRVKSSLSKPVAIPGVSSSASTPNGSSAMIRSGTGESSSTPTPINGIDPGSSTPTRPKNRRRSSHMLRIQLPPPITNRFKDGWPHAGSWQDALYGYYEDNDGQTAVPYPPTTAAPPRPRPRSNKSRKSTGVGSGNEENPITPQKRDFGLDDPSQARQTTPEQGQGESNGNRNGNGEADLTKRTKSRRQKRYRQALVPPTPSGLGFTPSTRNAGGEGGYPWNQTSDGEGEGTAVREKGFNWDKGLAQKEAGAGGRLNGGENLERQDTMATSMNSSRRGSDKGWWAVRKERKKTKKQRKRRTKEVEADWRQTYRRVLFLDARVTIWIRLMNLVVVVVSLGLAITIRLELEHLRLPGLIGSSTTLVMSYSCLTILHVLTAIYREYFGKPIGLWGLRSKMLWVCLDLLFVGLWSSAISLSTNDLIATPLQCTSDAPWWREGLSDQYSRLLNDLSNLTLIADQSLGQNATTQLISQSVSITLPATIINSPLAREACRRQAGVIALSLMSLLLYGGNMVISLFRIFETVRRTANVSKAVTL